jgi:nicotinate-nucleotide adenylyltransferase
MIAGGRTGILGGTFDPIHRGHLEAAKASLDRLALDRVLLLPSHTPPHRPDPAASAFHRFAMIALAIAREPRLTAEDLELRARSVSYTSDTLDRLIEAGFDPLQLFFIAGADAFAEIATWRGYPAFLDRAHFVVVSRSGIAAGGLRGRLPSLAPRMIDVPPPDPSRALAEVTARPTPAILLLDAETSRASSTEVRRRLGEGKRIDDLVPSEVAVHIRRHGLYGAAAERLHGEE